MKIDINKKKKDKNEAGKHEENKLGSDQIDLERIRSNSKFFENMVWINTKSASKFLGISDNALRIRVYRRQVKFYKLNSQLRFKLDDLIKLFERKG